MALYDTPPPDAPPAARLHAAHDFVARCRAWAVDEIARRRAAGRDTAEWESYLRFTDHTLRELRDGTLDAWFSTAAPER